jgi:deoxyxylulose-5-phosphate synthase
VHHIGIPDRFIEHGSREDCLVMAGIDAAGLDRQVQRIWVDHRPSRPLVASRAS